PKDIMDDRDAIVTIQAGAGGDEAGLFVADLFRMYTRYADMRRWQVEVLDSNESGIGGFKEVVMEVRGKGAYSRLKYEGGTHRVQRVPATESQGRIHTSTAKVIVLPEAEEIEIEIRPEDIRVDVYRSTGHGGQSVNTTDSAVRITHLPTGLVVTCQDEKSQLKNKTKALGVLRSRLWDLEQQKRASELGAARRSQVQTGDRSEKIRTYNFPQDRITDHRIGMTVHNLPRVLDGELDALIDALITADQAAKLAAGADED
ncbi:MAG: peptide chain release factor 1, partial [Chloroflexota bacterium]|nr:peptide chain release factor 1 [Chloroflexota bacterium]